MTICNTLFLISFKICNVYSVIINELKLFLFVNRLSVGSALEIELQFSRLVGAVRFVFQPPWMLLARTARANAREMKGFLRKSNINVFCIPLRYVTRISD